MFTYVYTMFTPMFTPCSHICLHHVHKYVYTMFTQCSHICVYMFTPMFTPCSHLCLYHVHTYVYTKVIKKVGKPFFRLRPPKGALVSSPIQLMTLLHKLSEASFRSYEVLNIPNIAKFGTLLNFERNFLTS